MRFWDSSAVVPLLCREKQTAPMIRIYAADMDMLVWGFTQTEYSSSDRVDQTTCRRPACR